MTESANPASTPRAMPLFYSDPQLVTQTAHGDWRLKAGDHAFAARAIAVPIVAGEFALVLRNYPILFAVAEENINPIALLGFDGTNLHVTDGQWEEGAYVPAYVRCYPFSFVRHGEQYVLGMDAACDRFVRGGEEGIPLFQDGKASPGMQQTMQLCDMFRVDMDATWQFSQALRQKNLLIDRRANATLPNGRQIGVDGFQIVDASRLAQLDEATVLDWHRKGYLALVHFHLASLDRFEQLLARRAARDQAESFRKPMSEPSGKA